MRRLREEAARTESPEVGDAELLERFLRARDEAAFEALVRRHGGMVFGVCRRLLGRLHDAEDAFQATFLALVRKGGEIRQHQSLAGWLYRVAHRIAVRARTIASRRGPTADDPSRVASPDDSDAAEWNDLGPLLDDEVHRLPEKPRAAVVLCYLGGRSTAEAARVLGVPRGTVLSRLAWARQRLRSRLLMRGVAPALAGVTGLLAVTASRAAPPDWVRATVLAGMGFAAGSTAAVSARAVALVEGVFRAMMIARWKIAVAMLALIALVGVGLVQWVGQPSDAVAQDVRRDPGVKPGTKPAAEKPDGDKTDAPAVTANPTARPLGTWERQFGPANYVVQFDQDRVHVTVDMTIENRRIKVEGDADYSVTKDSVLYGVITGADVVGVDFAKGEGAELAELGLITSMLVDHPFSIRYRVDDSVLTVKDVNIGGLVAIEGDGHKDLLAMKAFVVGRYKKKQAGGDPTTSRR